MKKLAPVLLVAVAALVLAPGALASHSITSTVFFDKAGSLDDNPSQEFIAGHVTSDSQKCLADRTVKIFAFYGTSPTLVPFDTATTGQGGGFSGIGPESSGGQDLEDAQFKLVPKSIGPKKHPKTCSGETTLAG